MRAPMFVLLLACGPAGATEATEQPRFDVRSTRVQAAPAEDGANRAGRFAVSARVSRVEAPPDPFSRFHAKALLKATSASCGGPDGVFANGFES